MSDAKKAAMAKWRAANKEHEKQYRADRKEAERERVRQWRKNNPDKVQAQQKRANATPAAQERNRKNAKVQKAARRGAPYTAEALDYIEILKGDPCVYCGKPYETTEHIIAVKRGGTGEWDNLSSACTSCNSSKGKKHLLQFMLDRL